MANKNIEVKTEIINRYSKYYVGKAEETRKIAKKPFVDFVAEIYAVPSRNAQQLIERADVTVNGQVVLNPNYDLQVGDFVRVSEGHFVVNVKFAATVE